MTDFMHRLASRALGDEPALSPRLPSWFEPVAAGTATTPAWDSGEAEAPGATRQAIAPAEPAAAPPPATRMHAESALAMPARQAMSSTPPPVQPFAARRIAPIERELATLEPRELQRPAKSEPAPMPNAARVPSTDVLRPAPVAVPVRVEVAKADVPVRAAPPTGVLLPPTTPVFPPAQHGNTAREPLTEARARGRDTAATRRAAPPAEPVVHVSIGRIEVRAAAAPAAAPARRREERAAGGLDDYLRQRQGKAAP